MDTFIIVSLALAYTTYILLLRRKSSHFGPFPSTTKVVRFHDPDHVQPVTFFDYIRRVFGVYQVQGDVWTVDAIRCQRWECPFCLSFWIAIGFAIVLCIFTKNYLLYPIYVLALSGVASAINVKVYDV